MKKISKDAYNGAKYGVMRYLSLPCRRRLRTPGLALCGMRQSLHFRLASFLI